MSIPSWLRATLHGAQLTFWKTTRLMLLAWGALNGLGLAATVEQAKQRISRGVARVSGSLHSESRPEAL